MTRFLFTELLTRFSKNLFLRNGHGSLAVQKGTAIAPVPAGKGVHPVSRDRRLLPLLFALLFMTGSFSACVKTFPQSNLLPWVLLQSGTSSATGSASYIVNSGGGLVTNESGLQDSFTVKLASAPVALVKICVSIPAVSAGEVQLVAGAGHLLGTDADCPTGGRLEFDSTNWSATQFVFVQGLPDLVADGTQPYTVTLTKVTTDPNYAAATLTNPTGNNYEFLTPLPVVTGTVMNTDSPTDVCISSGISDDISGLRIVPISATQITIEVDFTPVNNCVGCFTSTDGVDLKLFLNDTTAGTFTQIADWLMIPLAFNMNVLNTRSMVYTLPVLPSGTHFIRAAFIDRASATDQLNANCASGTSGSAGGGARHYDNVDAAFIHP